MPSTPPDKKAPSPGGHEKQPGVAVIILNYNGWQDTVECMESVCRSDYPHFRVIVVDNHSTDDSVRHLESWAAGTGPPPAPGNEALRHLSQPSIPNPLNYEIYRSQNNGQTVRIKRAASPDSSGTQPQLTLIENDRNAGFAAGNNCGIRFALATGEEKYFWLLNNDTVVEPDAMRQLVEQFEQLQRDGRPIAMLGSKLLYYDQPNTLQGLGGIYNKWLGVSRHVGADEADRGQYDNTPPAVDYLIGAAMFVCRDFLEKVGPLSEDYFLYFEELDWAERARRNGWELAVCPVSRVYHKHGRTIGSEAVFTRRSYLSDYYLLKNRLRFTRKFYPWLRFLVGLTYLVSLAKGILWGNWSRVKIVLRIFREELR